MPVDVDIHDASLDYTIGGDAGNLDIHETVHEIHVVTPSVHLVLTKPTGPAAIEISAAAPDTSTALQEISLVRAVMAEWHRSYRPPISAAPADLLKLAEAIWTDLERAASSGDFSPD